ncbi:hypothetical protein Fmac_023063 [Flemingia macrophylla]|uniref:TF-B3 domain-containing protein n=1 Tax=Flemingia macrophylla TaxID=520843 RepID=A0ABD1LM25_9FABA
MAAHRSGKNAIMPIRFFKIILKSNLHTIKIPNKFTKRYGEGLSNPVFLKPLDGTEWKVHFTNQNGEVWFKKGWKEFVENYSLDHGHLVLFKYEGTSNMEVLILDQTGLEIDYPLCDTPEEKNNLDKGDDESSVMVFDEWPHQNAEQSKGATNFSPRRPYKKMKGEEATHKITTTCLNRPKEARARLLAERFISGNKFFTIFIKPCYLQSKLIIPNLKGHIGNKQKHVMLLFDERSWVVKLINYRAGLGSGWLMFSREAGLQPEDVCIFELICRKNAVFRVHVFRS